MSRTKSYNIASANYLDHYRLQITYQDGYSIVVDFNKAIQKYAQGDYEKWKKPANFKRFKIDNGHLVWGRNWDLIFPPESIRNKTIESKP
jgi:hypothetical protein